MKKRILPLYSFLIIVVAITGVISCNPPTTFPKLLSQYEDSLVVNTSQGQYSFSFISESLVSVYYHEADTTVLPSHAIIAKRNGIEITIESFENELQIKSSELSIVIQENPFKITYRQNNTDLVSESGFFRNKDGIGFNFSISPDEALYGGGERALGMNRRGNRLELYNTPSYGYEEVRDLMYYSMPILLSSKQYMILWDNPQKGYMDLDSASENTVTVGSIGGRSSYTVVAGEDFYDIVSNYTYLTGRQPMVPRWVLGNFSSRFGYHSQQETIQTIDRFRKDKIPVDGVILDIFWFGKDIKGHLGNLDWDLDYWPEPQKMIDELKEDGVNTVLITEPFILKTSNKWDEAVKERVLCVDENGDPYEFEFYFGESGLIDVFNPKAVDWFWNIYKKHTRTGITSWWGDLGEPEAHPDSLLHYGGLKAEQVHNIYGHYWAKLIYDGLSQDFPELRPFTLMRSGYAGSQRYGMVAWSGDVSRSWGGFRSQAEIALQMGFQGLGYFHSDLGGFAGDYKDEELYTRWLQYGIFQPIFRPHAQEETPAEPVFWDNKTKSIAKAAIELRYRMLPFNYTLAHINSNSGIPFLTPLFFEEPTNKNLLDYDNSFLYGKNILVVPITEKEQQTASIYFPKGFKWYSLYSEDVLDGGQLHEISLVKESSPAYAREGSIIPMLSEVIQTTRDYSSEKLEVHYYWSKNESQFQMYEDDGSTRGSFVAGNYEYILFSAKNTEQGLKLNLESTGGTYTGRPELRTITWVLHHLDKNYSTVNVEGNELVIQNNQFEISWDGSPITLYVN